MTTAQSTSPDVGNTAAPPDSHISTTAQIDYWTSQSADVNGMLGGYPHVSRVDMIASKTFITKVKRIPRKSFNTNADNVGTKFAGVSSSGKDAADQTPTTSGKLKLVVDCGAGIGRITNGLLLHVANTVDIVEPVIKFTDILRKSTSKSGQGSVGEIFNFGLESWDIPADKRYDIVWIQWCLGHLTDKQAATFLQRCSEHLSEDGEVDGWIMVKENLSGMGIAEDTFDDIDSSVTRSDAKFKSIFEEAGLKIVTSTMQHGFPSELYPVKMYCLRPK